MFDRIWEGFVGVLMSIFLPLICIYQSICGNLFLNVSVHHAKGLEKIGDTFLIPFQYLFAGQEAFLREDGSWELIQKFRYDHHLLSNSALSIVSLPLSLALGSSLKGLSYLSSERKQTYQSLVAHRDSTLVRSNNDYYRKIGIDVGDPQLACYIESQGFERRPGDENHLGVAKVALREIVETLNEANILWWVDCGTLLGAYRYGGIIPWDHDIDIAILLPDFENARRAFNRLDSNKYMVQDWSGREFPKTFFKIYIRETGDMIDIYFYDIDARKQLCSYIFSMDQSIFFFDWWKTRERRFTVPVAFEHLFPLKKAHFDGIDVFVPSHPTHFLQRYYGENLAPVKIYDSITNRYEKDLSHPYWQNAHVH